MCGYCVENIYVWSLYHKIKDDNLIFEGLLDTYLQEQEDNDQVITKLIHEYEWDFKYLYHIIHCCNLYNRFFPKQHNHFQDISSGIEGFKSRQGYEFIVDSPEKVTNTIPILNPSAWIDLYRPETVLDDGFWLKFIGNNDLINASKEVLEHYIDWWLKGIGKPKNGLPKTQKQTKASDPMNDVNFDEGEKLFLLLPVFYFSLSFLAHHKTDYDLIEFIATKSPDRTPGFPGYDLWLQRTALHLCVQNKGINSIKLFWQKVRFEMIYIELIKCYRSGEDADSLTNIIQDYYFFLSNKGRYLIQDHDDKDEDSPINMLRNLESEILYS
jgi:hypothetical protein